MSPDMSKLISLVDAADLMNLSPEQVHQYIQTGRLDVIEQVGSKESPVILLDRNQVEQLAEDVGIEDLEPTEPEDEPLDHLDREQAEISFKMTTPRIETLIGDMLKGVLDAEPAFQRGFVWSRKKASKFIESALLDVPLPLIYTAEEKDKRQVVIDGQQRLKSFFYFKTGKFHDGKDFKLSGLSILSHLNDKSYLELDETDKRMFDLKDVPVCMIERKTTDPEVRFEIFHRLNTEAVGLSEQEIRNCIFRGPFNDLLKELAANEKFKKCLVTDRSKRMGDVELVLRFFAFWNKTYMNYPGRMKTFLHDEMEENKDGLKDEKKRKFTRDFLKAIDLSYSVFGPQCFRRYFRGTTDEEEGRWGAQLNVGLFEIIMFGFSQYKKNQIMNVKDIIREELLFLLTNDDKFIKPISGSTNDKSNVIARFKTWLESLEEIVQIPHDEPRLFSYKLKKQLFEEDDTCLICNQRIEELDDAAVDHIDEWFRGGRTLDDNARLAHRFCNQSRLRK